MVSRLPISGFHDSPEELGHVVGVVLFPPVSLSPFFFFFGGGQEALIFNMQTQPIKRGFTTATTPIAAATAPTPWQCQTAGLAAGLFLYGKILKFP